MTTRLKDEKYNQFGDEDPLYELSVEDASVTDACSRKNRQQPLRSDEKIKDGKIIRKEKESWVDKKVLTESEINSLKRKLNEKKITQEQIFGDDWTPKEITPEQTKKGYEYLMNQWKTEFGAERKNNPFGLREQAILEKFDRFELKEFHNIGNANFDIYVPLYEVYGDNTSFEYYWDGKVNIIG